MDSQSDGQSLLAPTFSSSGVQGSEDLIIPTSDDEEDRSISAQSTPLDLKRFSFAAK
jgi:hypothetical protein